MKTGNVILAIFLWLMIPFVGFYSLLYGITYGDITGNTFCCFIVPFILFILGLVVLLMGREKPVVNNTTMKDSDRRCPNCGRVIPFDAQICPYCELTF